MPLRSPFRAPHYILVGGRSRRFGSDKARHVFGGTPMAVRVAQAFAGCSSSTTLVARDTAAFADLQLRTIADRMADAGPLAGLCAALADALERGTPPGTPGWVLVSSCDLVDPQPAWIETLAAACREHSRAAVFRTQSGFEPFPGLYHTDTLPLAEAAVRSRKPAMRLFLAALRDTAAFTSLPPGTRLPLDADRPEALPA